jgi:hypothetical protein
MITSVSHFLEIIHIKENMKTSFVPPTFLSVEL